MMHLDNNKIKATALLMIIFVMAGCATPGMKKPSKGSSERVGLEGVSLVRMTAEVALAYASQQEALSDPVFENSDPGEYRVGPYDVLDIVVWGRTELNNPGGMAETPESRGRQVSSDGTIFYPFIGVVNVAGKTVEEVRTVLARGLAKYLKNPQINVRVGLYQAKKFYVTGEVNEPGVRYVRSEPQSLLDVISAAGGMTSDADLSTVYLTRGGKQHVLDLQSLYEQGNVSQNVWIFEGDTVHVPDNSFKKVFVIGEVTNQTYLPMHKGRMTLAEALTAADGVSQEFADARGVYVLRANAQPIDNGGHVRTLAFQLNARSPDAYLVADMFELEPRDVVYVSTLPMTRWNRVLSQIMPTVETIFQADTVITRSR